MEQSGISSPIHQNKFKLSQASLTHLEGVHPDLVAVVKLAIEISEIDFSVIDGVRTFEEQYQHYLNKASPLNGIKRGHHKDGIKGTGVSRHQTGHAVDLAPWVNGKSRFEDAYCDKVAKFMFQAAKELNISLEWGGNWKSKDKPHFQLPRSKYSS